ncbi:hypothetical protein QZH41_006830 [Actinostola sp. cb2023]|nr:hypothetical protein QZH41_006830 [Actinostola sp. cb2023]
MFTSQEYIDHKTGADGFGRLEYLQALVTEYQDSDRQENKEQVLANLANFAYDPINYEHFRKLNVIDLLLDITNEAVVQSMEEFSKSSNTRLSNLARVFLMVVLISY